MLLKASELEPGMSVVDLDHQERARLVYSATAGKKGRVTVLFGHPDQPEPEADQLCRCGAEKDAHNIGDVAADKEYLVTAGADGQRL